MIKMMSEEEFLKLSKNEVNEIIQKIGRPKNVVVVPDATRRTGIIYNKMTADQQDFEKNVIVQLDLPYLNLIKTIYDHGIETVLIPGLTHRNLNRGKQYVDSVIGVGLRSILTGKEWLEFYNRYEVKVDFYGDSQYLKKVTTKFGYPEVLDWCDKLKNETKEYISHRLFWGFGCSNSFETFRIIKLSIDFYNKNNKYPTEEDLIELYYGEHIDKIDIFIRPGEIRDSDCQPPLIGGNSQFYFPIAPLTELDNNFFRRILYDFIFCRYMTFDRIHYSNLQFDAEDVQFLKQYYDLNRNNIIGLGKKVSHFWLPECKSVDINYENKKLKNGRD